MYNKLFTKILDSSIWLEPTTTRIVWLTFLAAMDEDGFAQFASVANLAHRARVTVQEASDAVKTLEAPDKDSSDKDNEGCRIERVPGGWIILNAPKYRDMVTKVVARERTRLRVAKHRAIKRENDQCNALLLNVTPSEAEAEADLTRKSAKEESAKDKPSPKPRQRDLIFDAITTSCRIPLDQLNSLISGRIAKAKKAILESCPNVTPKDISEKAAEYRRKWPRIDLTPLALANNWASLGTNGTHQEEPQWTMP